MKKEISPLRQRFDDTGRTISQYSRAYGLDPITMSKVLDGSLTGVRYRKGTGNTRMCILRLQEDGIWIGALPWKKVE